MTDSTFHTKIEQFYLKRGRMPSYAEIAKLCGFQSKNAAYKLVDRLVNEGVVARDDQGKLIPHFASPLTLLGYVEAGFPSSVEEQSLDTLSLDEDIVRRGNASYALKVKGDSMINAGIHEGDLVLVEKCDTARNGSIVVAEIDHEWTLKYLRNKKGKQYLEAANPDYPDLYPKESLHIGGVVRAVIRQY